MVSSKHRRTLSAVFEARTRADIRWKDVEALLKALGAHIEERHGSAVMIKLGGFRLALHKPHPQPELKKHAVRSVRLFLEKAGVGP